MHKTNYPTNLTDKQWQVIENILENQKRKRKHSLREIFNAIMYLLNTGCQWRMLPIDFPKWELVYYYYGRWKEDGTFEVMETLQYRFDRMQKIYADGGYRGELVKQVKNQLRWDMEITLRSFSLQNKK